MVPATSKSSHYNWRYCEKCFHQKKQEKKKPNKTKQNTPPAV